MHLFIKTVAGVLLFAMWFSAANAADYANATTDELVQMRSGAKDLLAEDRESYRKEMQTRIQSMSDDERELFRQMNQMSGRGDGSGSGEKKRRGQGSGEGSGNKHRYGQNASGDEYGSGYSSRGGGRGQGRGRGRGGDL